MVISRRTLLQASLGLLPIQPSSSLTMQLDWHLNAQFAGLCIAQDNGYYRHQGLNVTLVPASPDTDVVQTVVSQPWTIGCAEESLILSAQAKGIPIVAIASMLQASPLALMSLPQSGLKNLQELIGKRVGIHSDGRKALELVLNQWSIDPRELDITDIPYVNKHKLLSNGTFDAVQCYALDEPIELAHRIGQPPCVLAFKDYGFDVYSQVIFTSHSLIKNQPQMLAKFLNATFSGWRWAITHPSQTARILVNQYVEPNYQDIDYQTASLEILADYVQPQRHPIGVINPKRWQQSAQQLAQANLIDKIPPLATSIDISLWS
ncbi:MAG: ABC transporter substrate-binding protein [Cyanobacteria bacterium P01_D01_bin.156]